MRTTKGYGWKPQLPDIRDKKYVATVERLQTLPEVVDLRGTCPPVYDQGDLGSCTANAIAAAIQFEEMKQGEPSVMPSRLFIYNNERIAEGDLESDGGAEIRDGIKVVSSLGVCPESEFPYLDALLTMKPSAQCYADAKKYAVVNYRAVSQDLNQLKACLASGYVFPFGITVYESFESDQVAQTGMVPMPTPDETVVGGHAICAVGYDDSKQAFIVRNSWGSGWGIAGYFYLPYDYVINENLASDFWQISLVK